MATRTFRAWVKHPAGEHAVVVEAQSEEDARAQVERDLGEGSVMYVQEVTDASR